MRQGSFGQAIRHNRERLREFRTVRFAAEMPRHRRIMPERIYERFPYVPANPAGRDERCAKVYEIQVQGLAKRLAATGLKHVVIGISGGPGFKPGIAGLRSGDGPAGVSPQKHPGLYDARIRYQHAHLGTRAPPDAGAGMRPMNYRTSTSTTY